MHCPLSPSPDDNLEHLRHPEDPVVLELRELLTKLPEGEVRDALADRVGTVSRLLLDRKILASTMQETITDLNLALKAMTFDRDAWRRETRD